MSLHSEICGENACYDVSKETVEYSPLILQSNQNDAIKNCQDQQYSSEHQVEIQQIDYGIINIGAALPQVNHCLLA